MIFAKHLCQIPRIVYCKPRILCLIQSQRKNVICNVLTARIKSTKYSTLTALHTSKINNFNRQIGIYRHCQFHTSSRRYVAPYLWVLLKTVLKGGSILTGRGIRQWWQALPANKRLHFIHLSKKQWKEVIAFITVVAVGFYLFYLTHLQVAPITGRKRFIAFNDKQFKEVMEFEAEQLQKQLEHQYLPLTHPYYKIVVNTLQNLVNSNTDIEQLQTQKWVVAIIDDPEVNAFVLPTGHVFVHKGLMDFIVDQNQLAIVLGHEMAHALCKHGAEQLSKAQLVDYFIIMAMTLLWAFIPADGIAVITQWFFHKVIDVIIHLPYNRALETEADKVGLELAAKACYDIRWGTVFWSMMAMKNELKGDKMPEWLSTHPASEKRSETFDHFIPRYLEMRCKCNCSPLPKIDPRSHIPEVKAHIDNEVVKKKTAGNIKRLKIPMKDYRTTVPPAALASNNSTIIPVDVLQAVKDLTTSAINQEATSQSKESSGITQKEVNNTTVVSSSSETVDGETLKNSLSQESTVSTDKSAIDSVEKVLPKDTSVTQNSNTKTT